MARVYNETKFTLTCNHIHQVIRAGKFATCTDERARLVPQNGQFRVEFDHPEAGEQAIDKEPATRKRVTRGSQRAEVTGKPEAERRDNKGIRGDKEGDTVWF